MHPQIQPPPPLVPPLSDGGAFVVPAPADHASHTFDQKSELDEAPPSRQLWVGNVTHDASEALLMESFAKYGNVDCVTVYSTRSYAFVEYRNVEDAKAAKAGLQGKIVGRNTLRIEFAKPAKPSRYLWIAGVGHSVTKEELEEEFKMFGVLQEFKLVRDHRYAIAEYEKLESAVAAFKALNRKCIGNEELRVDFLRSQPVRREDGYGVNSFQADGRLAVIKDRSSTIGVDSIGVVRNAQPAYGKYQNGQNTSLMAAGAAGLQARHSVEEPSKVLWIGYPASVRVDDERLRRAFILFGEVEHIKMVPGRNFCFVQFRNVDEARRAKDGVHGRLFNDPRVQIRFSNSEASLVRTVKGVGGLLSLPTCQDGLPFHESFGARPPVVGVERSKNSFMANNFAGSNFGAQNAVSRFVREFRAAPTSGSGGSVARVAGPVYDVHTHVNSRGAVGPGPNCPVPNLKQIAGTPCSNGLAPNIMLAARHADDGWNNLEEEFLPREFKRPKIGFSNSSERLHEAQLFVPHMAQHTGLRSDRGSSGGFQPGVLNEKHDKKAEPGTCFQLPSYSDVSQFRMVSSGSEVTGVNPTPQSLSQSQDDRWKWQGVIAKAGTAVCSVLSFPVGKGIDTSLPEVVNCCARTDLNMLAKHFYQAVDIGIISFLPNGDHESQSYQEFLHYLGDKHRAGVAKLNDGTTLFLVPPSDFSLKVLKLHDVCLFGVVLKLTQIGTQLPVYQQLPPPVREHHQHQHHHQLKPAANGSLIDCLKNEPTEIAKFPHIVQPVQNSRVSLGQSTNDSLTPEIIASLTALLPLHSQVPNGSGNVCPPGAEASGEVIFEARQGVKGSRPGLRNSQTNPMQSWSHDQNMFLQTGDPVPSITSEGTMNQHRATVQHTTPPAYGTFLPVSQIGTTPGHATVHNESSSLRPAGHAPQELPAEDLNNLVALLTRQQPSYGNFLSSHSQMATLANQSECVQSEPPPHFKEGFFDSGQIPAVESMVPATTQGNWNATVQQHCDRLLQNQGSTDPEVEKQNRFQATLQLAAALLQSIHNSGRMQDGTPQP